MKWIRGKLTFLFTVILLIALSGCSQPANPAKTGDVNDAETESKADQKEVSDTVQIGTDGKCYVYVAPNGDDSNTGTIEKPLATLGKALKVMQKVDFQAEKHVVVRGGKYYDTAVKLGPMDSGVTIEAAEGERPILYGGIPINNWEKDEDGFYSAKLPEVNGKQWNFRMLLVNDEYRPRARLPETGFYQHESRFPVRWLSTTQGGWERQPTQEELTTLKYKKGDLGSWLDVNNAEIQVIHSWDDSIVGVASIDESAREVHFSSPTAYPPGGFADWVPQARNYAVWNIREGMKQPGNWYLDRTQGRVVYWPKEGEDMNSIEVIAPTTESIIKIGNNFNLPMKDITIQGLELAVTNVPLMNAGFGAVNLSGAIIVTTDLDNLILKDLTVRNTGGWAVKDEKAKGVRIEGCVINNVGAGGIRLQGQDSIVANNQLDQIGVDYPSSIAVFVNGDNHQIRNNEISNTSYSGVNYGGKNGLIENNLFKHVMQKLVDGGAIYVGFSDNVTVRGNITMDIDGNLGHAYYLDEQTVNSVVEDNLSVNVAVPLHNHMAERNTLRNNVCINDGDMQINFARSKDYTVEKNIFYASGRITVSGINAIQSMADNIFYSGSSRVEEQELQEYNVVRSGALKLREGSIIADPLFKDWENGEYSFKANSPASGMGIQPFDGSQAGRMEGQQ